MSNSRHDWSYRPASTIPSPSADERPSASRSSASGRDRCRSKPRRFRRAQETCRRPRGFSEPAIITTESMPAAPLSNSRANISRARSLFSQNNRHSIVRNDAPSSFFARAILRTYGRSAVSSVHAVSDNIPRIDAEAIELRPRQDMQVLEFHGFDEIVEFMADAHRGHDMRSRRDRPWPCSRVPDRPRSAARRCPWTIRRELGVMDGHRGIGSDLARRRAEKQISSRPNCTSRDGRDFSLDFAARGLDLEAGIIDLSSCGAGGYDRPSDPGNDRPPAQHASDREGLLHRTARRMEIDRPLGYLSRRRRKRLMRDAAARSTLPSTAIQRSQPGPHELAGPFAR